MKKALLFALLMITLSPARAGYNSEARKIFEESRQKMTLRNVSMVLDLISADRHGNTKSRTLAVTIAELGSRKKVLIEFTAPESVRGTKIVTTYDTTRKGIIEIYTPATGRIQKLRASRRNLKVMGSKIPISRIGQTIDLNFNFSQLGTTQVEGTTCYKIRLQKTGKKEYLIAYISTAERYLLRLEKYDMNDQLTSVTVMSGYFRVNGAGSKVYPRHIIIRDLKTNEAITMNIHKAVVPERINPDVFTLSPAGTPKH